MKRNNLIIITIIILVIVGLIYLFINHYADDATDAMKFKKEYEKLNNVDDGHAHGSIKMDIPKDNPMVYSDLKEVLDILKNKSGVIYFGFPSCPWCRNIVPVLIDSAKENKLEKIYYLNPSGYRGTNNKEYNELMKILDSYLETDDDGEKTLYVPDVYFVKEGKILGHQLGSVDSQKDAYTPLTNEQREELNKIYSELIKEIIQ